MDGLMDGLMDRWIDQLIDREMTCHLCLSTVISGQWDDDYEWL